MGTPVDAQAQLSRVPKSYSSAAVVWAGIKADLYLHLASFALDPPHQLLFRPEYPPLFFLVGGRHEVGEDEKSCGGVKARLQYIRIAEVTTLHLSCLGRRDTPRAARSRVQKAREQGRAVKARPA